MTASFGRRDGEPASSPSARSLALAVVGWVGLAACLTMVFLAMRAVMGVGGSCADGGPYVVAQPCPDGATPSLLIGIWAGIGFALLASVGGGQVGGLWTATPVLAWSALFGSLGFNFLDFALLSAPPDAGVDVGGLVCGVLFWVMAFVPLVAVVLGVAGARPLRRQARMGAASGGTVPAGADGTSGTGRREALAGEVVTLAGPGQAPHRTTTVTHGGTTISTSSVILTGDDLDADLRAKLDALREQLAGATGAGATESERQALAGIAADFGTAITNAALRAPVDPGAPGADDAGHAGDAEPGFTEGTQALLDRLERLADMRDRGLLGADEYETAKAAIMAELEGRS